MTTTTHRGYLMLLAIVYGAIFVTVLGGLASFVLGSNRLQTHNASSAEAFSLAEAGLEYYRWFLAHYPDDLQNGTGTAGPYTLNYSDPEGGAVGTATISITGNQSCGQTTSVDIESTGTPTDAQGVTRTLFTRYAQPSVGQYSYVLNDSVWAGDDRIILGPYHSNGGIRMDGTANSTVSSSLSSWNCTSSYGCSPTQSSAPGVVGNGPNQELWEYPVPQVDFGAISADFGTLKTLAQSEGLYFSRYSTTNGQGQPAYWRGYHMTFNADGSITMRQVSSTVELNVTPVNSADTNTDRALINNQSNQSTTFIPPDCGLIFVEDNLWIDGTVDGKITVVAANVVNANIAPNVYIRNNIQYENSDGSDGLTVIAEHNILITPDSPYNLTLNGIFIAQEGAFGRNYYGSSSAYEPKGTLTILGTTVSNKRTGTKWCLNSGCTSTAGYTNRIDSYDRHMAYDPPPFTPIVSEDYQFINWREE